MTQTNLIDELESYTNQAVDTAAAHANQKWVHEMEATVTLLCRRGQDFTTDDVWQLMEFSPITTHEPRALGAVIRKLSKDGLIMSTGVYRKSMRKECHRRPLAVWRPVKWRSWKGQVV